MPGGSASTSSGKGALVWTRGRPAPPISSLNAEDVDFAVLLGAQFGTAILLDLYARSALIHNLNLNIDIHCLHLFISLSIYTSYIVIAFACFSSVSP